MLYPNHHHHHFITPKMLQNNLRIQVSPLPMKPSLQTQEKPSTASTQVASAEQLWPPWEHSSIPIVDKGKDI